MFPYSAETLLDDNKHRTEGVNKGVQVFLSSQTVARNPSLHVGDIFTRRNIANLFRDDDNGVSVLTSAVEPTDVEHGEPLTALITLSI
ncbi:hypothetical protein AZE42_12458 [Rhizopogon vesiculosus]|uniref:Uncharacterized protein n=1 Tax=Rhizopogon vesiculosus TaxID=180088 RepID=A0A1J8R485_9AGAM|nr:hypothetical protein AZE42_12458 [Rhizopogon vesiculosus]